MLSSLDLIYHKVSDLENRNLNALFLRICFKRKLGLLISYTFCFCFYFGREAFSKVLTNSFYHMN